MNYREISDEVAKELNINKKDVYPIVMALFKIIPRLLLKGNEIKLRDFITIRLDTNKAMEKKLFGGELIQIPKRWKLKVIVSGKLKKQIDAKKAY